MYYWLDLCLGLYIDLSFLFWEGVEGKTNNNKKNKKKTKTKIEIKIKRISQEK